MIRIIFNNGELIDCDGINKVYVEQYELDKITVVGKMEEEQDVQINNKGAGKSDTDTGTEDAVD